MRDLEAWISQTEVLINYGRNGTAAKAEYQNFARACVCISPAQQIATAIIDHYTVVYLVS